MPLSDSFKSLSHHAYCLIGGALLRDELISILEEKHRIPVTANPDLFDRKYEIFTIDDAREVKGSAAMRPVNEKDKKIFILVMNGITVEAQNALLKLLEEPPEYAHFFLIIPSAHLLLPTVRSRVHLIEAEGEGSAAESKEMLEEAKKFVKASAPKRLEVIKKLMDEISKEKKTKQDAIDFLNAVQAVVYEEKGVKEGQEALEAIESARKYLHDRAPSVKMLLEFVSLSI